MPLDYYERICVPSLMQPRPLRLHVVHASHYKGLRAFQKIPLRTRCTSPTLPF